VWLLFLVCISTAPKYIVSKILLTHFAELVQLKITLRSYWLIMVHCSIFTAIHFKKIRKIFVLLCCIFVPFMFGNIERYVTTFSKNYIHSCFIIKVFLVAVSTKNKSKPKTFKLIIHLFCVDTCNLKTVHTVSTSAKSSKNKQVQQAQSV
jgi:hypothetical protein